MGCDLVICARRKEPLEQAAREMKESGRKVVAIPADLTKAPDAQNFVQRGHGELGRIDILVNNAGSAPGGIIESRRAGGRHRAFASSSLGSPDTPFSKRLPTGGGTGPCPSVDLLLEPDLEAVVKKPRQTPLKGHHELAAYDLAADGTVSNRRVLVDYAPESGPDGLIADVDGNIYAAVRSESRPGIYVYNAQGKELAVIPTGDELPTNVGFGRGEESDVLYVTSGKSLYKIQMAKDGYQLPSQ